ncbi:hypothetical protein TYRP_021758 [Tyrophagus putrescentiae]|nr:hypothetical protein TYRP_021758 [Tyrophagus putrescentiae]
MKVGTAAADGGGGLPNERRKVAVGLEGVRVGGRLAAVPLVVGELLAVPLSVRQLAKSPAPAAIFSPYFLLPECLNSPLAASLSAQACATAATSGSKVSGGEPCRARWLLCASRTEAGQFPAPR